MPPAAACRKYPVWPRDTIEDPLTTILRSGARRLLAQAIEAEAEAFPATMKAGPRKGCP
jgi:hypothetical protein